jgi:acetolactate synthase small subunit
MSATAVSHCHPAYTACFAVHASVDPSVLPRVLAVFARRGLVPTTIHSTVCEMSDEGMQIDLQMEGLDDEMTVRLAESLRQIVGVACVLTADKRSAMMA